MDFFTIVEKRRSIREFKERTIGLEALDKIKEAALRAPSSRGLRPWEFVIVSDKKILKSLAQSKESGSDFLAEAPLAIVICADETVSDVWVEDTAIVATYISLAAQALGLASCWSQIRERKHQSGSFAEEYIQDLLNLPTRLKVTAILALGYPREEKPSYNKGELPFEKFHKNEYH